MVCPKHFVAVVICFLLLPGSETRAQSTCRTSLSHLNSRIPSFTVSELQQVRAAVLGQDLVEAMRSMRRHGLSPEAAVRASLDQAREMDRAAREALQTAGAVDAFGTTDDEFLDRLKAGTLQTSNCTGIRNTAICSAIINRLGAVANRAVAAEMQCHIRAGTWPQ